MLTRIFRLLIVGIIVLPIAHMLLYFLNIAAGNIASPTQYVTTSFVAAWQNYKEIVPQLVENTYQFPGYEVGIWHGISARLIRSIGLLIIAAIIAIIGGVWLGMRVSRSLNTILPRWFVVIASTGNTLQSLFVASSGVAVMYFVLVYTPYTPPLPINGFGWDVHLVLPVFALCIRPLMSIAHDTATLFGQASQQPYVIATQARGLSNTHITRAHILPAQQTTIGLVCVANIRQMIAELFIVEIIFGWGGIGESIVRSIIPPTLTNIPAADIYLDAPTFASMGICIVVLFICLEIIRNILLPRHVWAFMQEPDR